MDGATAATSGDCPIRHRAPAPPRTTTRRRAPELKRPGLRSLAARFDAMQLDALRGRWRRSLAREIQRAPKRDLDIEAINLALAVVDRRLVALHSTRTADTTAPAPQQGR